MKYKKKDCKDYNNRIIRIYEDSFLSSIIASYEEILY